MPGLQFRDKVQSIRLAITQQTANKTWSDRLFEIARYDLSRAETDYVSCYGFLNSQEIILQSLMAVSSCVCHKSGVESQDWRWGG